MKTLAYIAIVSFLSAPSTVCASIASDNASNYATWTNGSNGGSGFDIWYLSNSGISGHLIDDASNQGTNSAGLNTSNQAFAMYADSGSSADAYRKWSAPLALGEVLSFDLAFSFDNGAKGFNLQNNTAGVFNFNINSSGYSWEGGGSSAMTTYTGVRDQGVVINAQFTRTASGVNYAFSSAQDINLNTSGAVALADVDEIHFYVNNAGSGAGGNLYFNNLNVIPEPSAVLLFLSGLGMIVTIRRHRKS